MQIFRTLHNKDLQDEKLGTYVGHCSGGIFVDSPSITWVAINVVNDLDDAFFRTRHPVCIVEIIATVAINTETKGMGY